MLIASKQPPQSRPALMGDWSTSTSAQAVNLGAVYTPSLLAEWVSRKMLDQLPANQCHTILDPACGDAALLAPLLNMVGSNTSFSFAGADIDQDALTHARQRLPDNISFYHVDSLCPSDKVADAANARYSASAVSAWRELLGNRPITGVIANPPWGADISHSTAKLRKLGYTLANGQFDSFDLFIELCLALVSKDAILAFIIPDSIFLPEHEPLRRLILQTSRIEMIARLGEGFFPGVYRGTVVLVLRADCPEPAHTVQCFRLTREWRQRVLAGTCTLDEAEAAFAHSVPQGRFSQDPEARFDIDVREGEHVVQTITSAPRMPWTRWFESGRGIELSKHGRVIACPSCQWVQPLPRHKACECGNCGVDFKDKDIRAEEIIRPLRERNTVDAGSAAWYPLIVGEDVDRYQCAPSREVRLGVLGINYKNPRVYQQPRLLVRKTGVGIKAAIDNSGAFTNQVVFHYYVPPLVTAPPFLLEYVQGVLCSRVLFAYHLRRMGESEWRSHPYITQRVIASLPIPDLSEGTWQWNQAQAIAAAVRQRQSLSDYDHRSEADILIDCLVAGLFELTEADCLWVLRVLEEAEPLEPIRTLRLQEGRTIRPVLAT